MPVSEKCSAHCGASIDLLPSLPVREAKKILAEWRAEHKHEVVATVPTKGGMGFDLLSVVSDAFNDGESPDSLEEADDLEENGG